MPPIRLKAQYPTDLEGIRRYLLTLAPRLEARQPGITAELARADLTTPLLLGGRAGDTLKVNFQPQGMTTLVLLEATPPTKPMGKLALRFWHWRTRALMRWGLKQVKRGIKKQVKKEDAIARR